MKPSPRIFGAPTATLILATAVAVVLGTAATIAAPVTAAQRDADQEMLTTCVAEAFPEGEPPGAPPKRTFGGDCIGLIARSTERPCDPSTDCVARETAAWLAIARGLETDRLPERNKAAVRSAVGGLERQAKSLCVAAAALSAWGGEQVAKGRYRVGSADECLRDAVAGMVVPLMGYARGN